MAFPALQRDLNASVADVQWVVEAYSLFLAALLLVGGQGVILGIVLVHSFNPALDVRLTALHLSPPIRTSLVEQRSKLAGIDLSGLGPTSRTSVREAIDASFVDGFRRVMFVGAALALLGAVNACVLIRTTPTR